MSVSTVGLGAFNFSEPLIEHIEHQDVSSDIDEGQGWTISSELELGDIQIVRISGQEIIMTSLEVERAPVTITIDSETRHIHFENRFSGRISGFNFLFFGFIERAGVVIEIPEDLIVSNIDLEATTGRVDIRGFTVEQINLTVLTGSLTLTDVHVNGLLFARTTTGSITVQNSQAEQFDLKTTTGTINVQRSTFDEATLKVTTGSIKLTTINTSAAPGTRLDAVSTTGSVRLENVYLMRLDLTTTTGSIYYDNADKSFQPERILARATTGSVNVTVQERP